VVAVLPFVFRNAGGGSLALFHSVAQIQGFLTCFVVGFLLTLVPRHTRTAHAAPWEVLSSVALPTVAVLCAWLGESAIASWLWLVLLALVMAFTLQRLRARHSSVNLAPVLLWVPASIAAGAIGAVLVAGGPWLAFSRALDVWAVGRGLLVQGFVTGLVLGIGGFLLPQVSRGEPPPARGDPVQHRRSVALHSLAAVAFFGSFPLEVVAGSHVGFGVRALVAGAVLLGAARIHRVPSLPGVHRKLMWLAAWLVPLGFLLGAVAPRFRGAALHVLFVGGFAQITLAVSAHVVLWREGRQSALSRSPLAVRAMAVLLATAFTARIAATIDLKHVAAWLEVAAYAFSAAVVAWAAVVGPALLGGGPAARNTAPRHS
jgi:uncharacterized protein involved in response to NO